jgi:phage terminase small subunit
MTENKFADLAITLWRARKRFDAVRKRMDKRGLVIKQHGKLRANPAVKEYVAAGREVKRLTALLAAL